MYKYIRQNIWEIIGGEERSWCNDGKTVSGWAEEVASLSLPVSTNQILHSDNRAKHFMPMHKCTGRCMRVFRWCQTIKHKWQKVSL